MVNLSKTCDFMILLLLVIQYTLGIVIGLATNFNEVAGFMERVHTNVTSSAILDLINMYFGSSMTIIYQENDRECKIEASNC